MPDCPHCGKTFGSEATLDAHIANSHATGHEVAANTKDDDERGGCFGFFLFLFGVGILSLILGTINEIFDLGIWHGDYPGLGTKPNGSVGSVPVGYGKFMWEFALMTLAYGLIALLIAAFRSED